MAKILWVSLFHRTSPKTLASGPRNGASILCVFRPDDDLLRGQFADDQLGEGGYPRFQLKLREERSDLLKEMISRYGIHRKGGGFFGAPRVYIISPKFSILLFSRSPHLFVEQYGRLMPYLPSPPPTKF